MKARKPDECSTRPMGILEWLKCWICWEVKAGVVLLVLSQLLLFWHQPPAGSPRWWLGTVFYWGAIVCLVWGLIRDLWLIATTKFNRHDERKQ